MPGTGETYARPRSRASKGVLLENLISRRSTKATRYRGGAGEPKGQGIMLDIEDAYMVLVDVGTVQLWYGDEIGVVWEAFYDTGVQHRPEHERLLHQLWSACEAYLQKKGARYAFTYARDPNYEDAWYGAFLHARGYRRDPARAHLPGEQMVVVKGLGV